MKIRKLILIALPLVLLVAVFAVVRPALAIDPVPTGQCGKSTPTFGPNGLAIKKTVECSSKINWTWDILKSASKSSLLLTVGQEYLVDYTVTASAVEAESDFHVSGEIFVSNISSAAVMVSGVSDSLGAVSCPVAFPFELAQNGLLVCTYTGSPAVKPTQNVATVTDAAGVNVSTTAAIDWTKALVDEIDECANVNDTNMGDLGTVCAGAQTTFTFNYTIPFKYGECGYYTHENVASFVTNNTGATGSSKWIVDTTVPCEGGCSLTPGYWKTHSIFGPARYDDTWAQIGETTPFFLSGKTYYDALWKAPKGNAYWILAHAYIAAQLNQLNGADFTAAQTAFNSATVLFQTYTPSYIGGLSSTSSLRKQFIALATTLDDYNNGLIGPGHCSE